MTINLSDNNPRANYTATSGQTAFTIPFDYFDDGDINVYQNGTLKTITTHYTISGSTVTLVTGATAGDKIAITRDVPLERTTDLTSTYNAASINNQLDTIVAQIADLDDRVSRSISLNDYEVGVSLDLPATADRLGKTIQFNSSTGALEVGPSGDELTSIASISDEITALDGISSNITSVAGYLTEINNVGDNISSVTSVSGSISSVGTVSTNIADVNSVAGSITNLNDVADSLDQVELVATSISNVDIVGPAIANVNTVASNITNINTVSGISSNITTVAGITAAISTVNSNAADITSVSNNIDDVNDVANVITKVTTVADNIANVNTVAPAVTYVSTLANNISNINLLAPISADITAAAAVASDIGDAATNAAAAISAKTAAESARDATLAAFDSFDDRYLGAKTADPSVDNDGNALVGGALYYNSVDEVMKVYTGSTWVAAYASLSGALLVANNLSDLANAASARTNLGLGTAATTASTDYATAAQGALADTAIQPSDSPTFAGLTTTADVSFGDNDKAIFGAGNDLQIYHDGSQSYIDDAGTGRLNIRANDRLYLRDTDDTVYAVFYSGAGSFINHNGVTKLATTSTGIDVTGTVTADGLTVDTNTLHVDSTNNRVGIGTSSPSEKVTIGANSVDTALSGTSNSQGLHMYQRAYGIAQIDSLVSGTSNSGMSLRTYNNGVYTPFIQNIQGNTTTFATAGTERMRINSSGNVIINNTTDYGDATLYLTQSADNKGIGVVDSGLTYTTFLRSNALGSILSNNSNKPMIFETGSNERMRIDSSGNVGIGTSSPSTRLSVVSPTNAGISVNDGTVNTILYNTSSANATIGTTTNHPIAVYTNNAERMRIDSSGNLLVGTTNTFPAGNNVVGTAIRPDGDISITKDGDIAIFANRKTSDGDIMQFRKDGTTVGSISTASGDIEINSASGNSKNVDIIGRDSGGNARGIAVGSGSVRTNVDNAIDLGASGNRFKDLYLSGGVYLGGTGAANKLDDYEEGTWTVGVSFDTSGSATVYSTAAASGRYIKIGNTVHVRGFFQTSSISSPVGTLRLTGLPFAVSGVADTAGSIGYTRRWGSDLPNLKITAAVGGTTCYFNKNATNATTATFLEGSDLSASANYNSLYFQITYQST